MTSKTTHELARDLLALPDIPVYAVGQDGFLEDPVAVLKESHPEDPLLWPPYVAIEVNDLDEITFLEGTTMRDPSPLGT